jgi:hypothetical protein
MFFSTTFYYEGTKMYSKLLKPRSRAVYFIFILFLLHLTITLSVAYSEITEGELYKIQMVIPPKGAVEYNITVDESGYIVFRISLISTDDFSKAISINLLRDYEEYLQYYYIKGANNVYGWSRLKPGNYRFIINNSIEKAIPAYGYILIFRNYDPRLSRLIDEKIYGVKNGPAPVGIADYGVYINKETNHLVCYRYSTKEVIGIAYINKLDGYSVNPYNKDRKLGELSLQLNLVVEARALNGKLHTLWIQNIYVLKNYSDALYYRIDDEVQNITVFGRNITDPNSIKGKGKVISYRQAKVYQYYDRNWKLIAKPFKPVLLLLHVKVNGNKIYFAHGYFVDRGNYFYEVQDEVVLTGYKNLNIVVDGCNFTGKPLNMELIIGGRDANYRLFVANNIDMKLALLIKNTTWVPPPAAWSIGASSIEKALNVASDLDHPIVARLIKGVPEAKQLWSKDISSKISLSKLKLYIVRFSNGTSSIRVTPISALKELRAEETYKVGPLSIILIQEKKTNVFAPYYHYIAFGLAVALIATTVFIMLQRRRKT